MHRGKSLNRFQLDYQSAFNEEIDPECVVYDNAIVSQWYCHLTLDPETPLPKRFSQKRLVCGLKQTGAEVAMEMETAIDCLTGNAFQQIGIRHLRVFV